MTYFFFRSIKSVHSVKVAQEDMFHIDKSFID